MAQAGYTGSFYVDNGAVNSINYNAYCNNDEDEFLTVFLVAGETLDVTVTATSNDNVRLGLIVASDVCTVGCNNGLACPNLTGDWGAETINYTATQTGWHTVKVSETGGSAMNYNVDLTLTCGRANCDCI